MLFDYQPELHLLQAAAAQEAQGGGEAHEAQVGGEAAPDSAASPVHLALRANQTVSLTANVSFTAYSYSFS